MAEATCQQIMQKPAEAAALPRRQGPQVLLCQGRGLVPMSCCCLQPQRCCCNQQMMHESQMLLCTHRLALKTAACRSHVSEPDACSPVRPTTPQVVPAGMSALSPLSTRGSPGLYRIFTSSNRTCTGNLRLDQAAAVEEESRRQPGGCRCMRAAPGSHGIPPVAQNPFVSRNKYHTD